MRNNDVTGFTLTNLVPCEWNGLAWTKHSEVTRQSQTISGSFTSISFTGFGLTGGRANHIITLGDINDATLPVELTSFLAIQAKSGGAQLQWTTESESDLLGYRILRSTNGSLSTSFSINKEIIPGHNIAEHQTYMFLDTDVEYEVEYTYWLESVSMEGFSDTYGPISITLHRDSDLDVPKPVLTPGLTNAYPNPFNPDVEISYYLAVQAPVQLDIYNLRGQKVWCNDQGTRSAGIEYSVTWDGRSNEGNPVGSGLYFVRLHAGSLIDCHQITLLK
jgi:hypothetical protein